MPDLLGSSSDWLERQRHQHLTRPVVYKRGSHELEVQATIGRTEFPTTDDHGALIHVETRDYLFLTAELAEVVKWHVPPKSKPEPQPGDQIIDCATVYLVTAIAGEKCWRFSDQNRKTTRVHVKLVATDPHHAGV